MHRTFINLKHVRLSTAFYHPANSPPTIMSHQPLPTSPPHSAPTDSQNKQLPHSPLNHYIAMMSSSNTLQCNCMQWNRGWVRIHALCINVLFSWMILGRLAKYCLTILQTNNYNEKLFIILILHKWFHLIEMFPTASPTPLNTNGQLSVPFGQGSQSTSYQHCFCMQAS